MSLDYLILLVFPFKDNTRITGIDPDFIYVCAVINSTK